MRAWLLDPRRTADVERALRSRPSADLEASIRPKVEASRDNGQSVLNIAGSEAEITVRGVLTEQFDWWLEYSCGGCTGYEDIRAAIAQAEADPNVKRIIFAVSSPGGEAAGLHVTVQAIEAMQKPTSTRGNCALSAAFAIAAATGEIKAESAASEFGCLGVAMEFGFWAQEEIVTLTNTESPDKRPDPRTPEGKKAITAYLDAIYAWYADGIARGREVSLDKVNTDFGRGAVLMAPDAKKRGMIDGMSAQRGKTRGAGASAQRELDLGDGVLGRIEAVSHDGGKTWTSASIEMNPPTTGGNEGAAQPSPSTQHEDTMNKQVIATALGLAASATDEELEAAVVALATKHKAHGAQLSALLALTGKDAEESVGVVLAWKSDSAKLPAKDTELADANAKILKLEQKAELDTAITLAKAANKLTPAEEKSLRDMFEAGDITLKGIKSNLEAKAAHPALENAREQKTAPEAKEGTTTTTAALTHDGKTWAQLTGPQKVALKKSDIEHYNAMRTQALGAAA